MALCDVSEPKKDKEGVCAEWQPGTSVLELKQNEEGIQGRVQSGMRS